MNKKRKCKDENWIREHQDDPNIDWKAISSFAPQYSLDFVREFADKLIWLWVCYAMDIEYRRDIINEFQLERVIDYYNQKVDCVV